MSSKNTNTETTDIATASGFAALSDKEFLRDAMNDECAGLDFQFDRIKIPAGGGTVFEIPADEGDETVMVKDITGVILFNHPANSYYTDKYQGGSNPPDCGSFDGITGTGNPGGQCKTCSFNQYGSGEGQAKACFASLTRKTQLSETTAVGETITEVGIGYGSSSTSLATHAMLKDMNGNPISIEKTDTDIINIYATVFAHWSTSQYDSGDVEFFPRVPADGKNSSYVYAFMGWLFGLGGWSSYLSVWFNPGTNPNFKDYGTSTVNAKYRKTVTPTYDATTKTMTITMERAAVCRPQPGRRLGQCSGRILPGRQLFKLNAGIRKRGYPLLCGRQLVYRNRNHRRSDRNR